MFSKLYSLLSAKLAAHSISPTDITAFLDIAKPGAILETKPGYFQHDIEIAQTTIGGLPDLPINYEWPISTDGRPGIFFAQINLHDFATLCKLYKLPDHGLLSFFYHGKVGSPIGVKRCTVLYFPDLETLSNCSPPTDDHTVLDPCPINTRFALSLPNRLLDNTQIQFGLSDEGLTAYPSILKISRDLFGYSNSDSHTFLGYPGSRYRPETLMAEYELGLQDLDASLKPEYIDDICAAASEWQSLLYTSWEPNVGEKWLQYGIDFLIHQSDISDGTFDYVEAFWS